MIKKQVTLINDFSGGEDTKTPISTMGLNKSPNMRNWHCAGLGSRLIKRGGFAKINLGTVASDELDTYYPPGYQTYDYALRDTVARTQISQGFKPKTTDDVIKVRLWLKKVGAPAGNINIEIQSDNSGVPSGTLVPNGTSDNIDISTLTTSYAWYTFIFSTKPSLTAGTQYHIAFQGSNAINGTTYAIWGADDYDVVFPDGSMGTYNGTTWAADGKYDGVFEIYITGGARGNDGFALWDFSSRGMMLGIWGITLYKMDKNSAGTPDGTWDNLYNIDTEMDYMEYATDGAAQAAYVTSGVPITDIELDYMEYANDGAAQAAYVSSDAGYTIDILTGGTPSVDTDAGVGYEATEAVDNDVATRWTSTDTAFPHWFKYDLGAAVTKIVTKLRLHPYHTGDIVAGAGTGLIKNFTLQGSNNDSDWDVIHTDVVADAGDDVWQDFTFSPLIPYRYYKINITSNYRVDNYGGFFETEMMETKTQCYSEDTIIQQGTYSLKVIAAITDSLNDTLTNTLGAGIDLTDVETLKFDIYASRTGSNVKIGIHDSGGTTTEHTANVLVSNTWQTETIDISAVANANKDDIDSIIITIVNADALNVFYIDNFLAPYPLQCFSESTIKQQGTYSLKAIARQPGSLNETLTNTLGAPIDLSNQNTLKFDIRSSRTGSNIKIGIHDSGGTTTEITPNITVADVWQTVTWDISSVSNANKDDIDSIIITIVNADAENTFYMDNFYAASLLTTSRYWTFGDWQSGRALINTDEGLYTYIGTGSVSLVAAAPLGKFITIWKKYVFLAGIRGSLNQARYCTLSDYTTWPVGNTLNFDTSDGDVITGIRTLKGKLYVFKRYSVHRISYLGSNPTFQVDQILGMGCPSHYCIKEVDMGGEIGSVLIFPTTDKKLAIFDGYNVQIVHDTTTEKSNDLFAVADDQPITFSDMDYTYIDKFHAVIKSDSFEYILYCVLNGDTEVKYGFVFDYKTGGVYPYDGQIFSSSLYMMSTNKSRILYTAGYTGYMWEMESGDDDDSNDINAYFVTSKIKPKSIGLLNRLLLLGINYKEITSATTLNMTMKYRLDWNVSWLGSTNFNYDHNDELAFGKTSLFDIGTIENMFQVKITEDSSNPAPTIYSLELHGEELGVDLGDRATS